MKRTHNLADWLSTAAEKLAPITETPRLEAQLLAAHVIKQSRTWLMSHMDLLPGESEMLKMESLLSERLLNVPLPYILGEWSFYGLDFKVTPAVLIPRPETELLVSEAQSWIISHPGQHRVVDVGTGSGCIAVSLAKNNPSLSVVCVDISLPALKIARFNADECRVAAQLLFVQSNLLSSLGAKFDILCANLPYIPSKTLESLPVRLFEPLTALDGGTDGLDLIRLLLAQSISSISPGGLLLFEIESGQNDAALQLANETYPGAKCQVMPDLAGLPRLLRIEVKQ